MAASLYAWLIKDVSPLRSLLAYLSGAGCWYAAACHEKTARAFVSKMSKESFQSMAVARLCSEVSDAPAADEMKGLGRAAARGSEVSVENLAP